ncbi:hypothetical protein EG329_012548 [Mollisiaceae sp. DMI_Dod_QoI]|nr:hypothetical protein EG329_012548 [Helotiales sp. DMI_Dod_QoI]
MGGYTAFFYGTLMAREILYRVCYGTSKVDDFPALKELASELSIQPALLHNYCRHKVADADYPAVIPQLGHTVRGTYVTGLTDTDVTHLDRFEGSEYTRKKVKVMILEDGQEKGESVEAQTYVWSAPVARLEREEWDYDEFRREKMHRWTDASEEYEGKQSLNIYLENGVSGAHDPTGGRAFAADLDVNDTQEEMLHAAA